MDLNNYNELRDLVDNNKQEWPIKNSEQSDWQLYLTDDTIFIPGKDKEPNWFNRKMQELFFGFKWRKK